MTPEYRKNPKKSLEIFSLANFEGTLDLLMHLVQKKELDVCQLQLKKLTQQIQKKEEATIDLRSDQMAMAATFVLMKSRKLLPIHEEASEDEIFASELFEQILAYEQITELAQRLALQEKNQADFFPRLAQPLERERGLGLDAVALDDLGTLLADVMKRAANHPLRSIESEPHSVEEAIAWILETVAAAEYCTFEELFPFEVGRDLLIVRFLALLELMKVQKIVMEGVHFYGA